MSEDARFEDGSERPLNLGALDGEDLQVISALVQDAVLPVTEIRWQASQRRLALLINRLRNEDLDPAQRLGRPVERVRALLVIDNVEAVSSQGVDRSDSDLVLSILSIDFDASDAPAGAVTLTLAGDGALRAQVEALDVTLRDVTRPYKSIAGKAPDHALDD